jgi:integrase
MLKGTRKPTSSKPAKPYADFPLFPHATRRWAKKIRGKLHYFGPWDEPQAAVDKYLSQRDDLHAGRTPRVTSDGVTIRELANRFLTAKERLVESGELSRRSFLDYLATCSNAAKCLGRDRLVTDLVAQDFEELRSTLAKGRGPVSLGNEIQRVRILFKYGYDSGLIATPIRFGPMFKRPSKKILRQARQAKGVRMFDPNAIRQMIRVANVQLQAMVLLGINCGFGNSDVANLPLKALDLKDGWVDYPRPKTAMPRRVPLWRETIKAIEAWLKQRPTPREKKDAGLVFVTKRGLRWAKDTSDNPVSKEFSKLLKELKLDRPGLNFYALRHTFETIGGESLDQVAVDAIMGHAPAGNDMASAYRERITDERLASVTRFVRKWLFSSPRRPKHGKAIGTSKG